MRIKMEQLWPAEPEERITLEQFADRHELVMLVTDGPANEFRRHRYQARFEAVEVKDRDLLVTVWGSGDTIKEAIADYAAQIAGGQILVQNAYGVRGVRCELVTPKSWAPEPEHQEPIQGIGIVGGKF